MASPARSLRIRSATLLGGLALCTASARAATISVDTTADFASRDTCTLRSAIVAANTNAAVAGCSAGDPGLDTIDLRGARKNCPTRPCNVGLQSALPKVTEDLTINGGTGIPAIARVGTASFPMLDLGAVSVTVLNVVLTGGASPDRGGAIRADGTTLTVTNVTFNSNHAVAAGGAISGLNGAKLHVTDSTFDDNGGKDGGAIACVGGSLYVSGSVFTKNAAGNRGGAIFADQVGTTTCVLTVTGSTFDGNKSGPGPDAQDPRVGLGGALYTRRPAAEILDSTFVRNRTPLYSGGGAIALVVGSINDRGKAIVANVTVSENSAGGAGGGMLIGADADLFNVTVTRNVGGRGFGSVGGVYHDDFYKGVVVVQSSIIAGNFHGENNTGSPPRYPDVYGTFDSKGYNLVGTGDGSRGFNGNDQVGGFQLIDPLLGPLADNGGPTQTHAPLPGSPAIDRGNPDDPKRESACWETDQRGIRRPVDGDGDGNPICDVGAFEVTPQTPDSTTTTTIADTNTTSTIAGVSPTSTTTTSTIPGSIGACVLSQLPDDSIAGVRCAVDGIRATLNGPPAASCTCKKCSLTPRLDKLENVLGEAESATKEKACRHKLKKARRLAKSLSAKAGSLADRQCFAPADRASALDGQTDELARRAGALAASAFCDGR